MHTSNKMHLETIFKSSFNWTNLAYKMSKRIENTELSLMHKFHYAKGSYKMPGFYASNLLTAFICALSL